MSTAAATPCSKARTKAPTRCSRLCRFRLAVNAENLIANSDTGLILRGNSLANSITGGGGNDTLAGGSRNDTLKGGDGNDTLNGGGGADAMDGGDGNDRYFIDNVGDTVTDSSGIDTVFTTIDHSLGANFERLFARSDAGLSSTATRWTI